jgi:hypothetical protein
MEQLTGVTMDPATTARSDRDASGLKALFDFQQRAFWDSANLLGKSTAFYLAITAALAGYTVTRSLTPELARLALSIAIGASIAFWLVVIVAFWGLSRIITRLEVTARLLDSRVFDDTQMARFFARWRRALMVIAVCMHIVGAMFVIGLILLLRSVSAQAVGPYL